jgi:hypothetical protein
MISLYKVLEELALLSRPISLIEFAKVLVKSACVRSKTKTTF